MELRRVPSSLNDSLTTSHCQILPLKCLTWSVMCRFRTARSSALDNVVDCEPPAAVVPSHFGSWLCQTSVWPRTSWPFRRAEATSSSAGAQLYLPRVGSTTSHFMTFSGVTVLNC